MIKFKRILLWIIRSPLLVIWLVMAIFWWIMSSLIITLAFPFFILKCISIYLKSEEWHGIKYQITEFYSDSIEFGFNTPLSAIDEILEEF